MEYIHAICFIGSTVLFQQWVEAIHFLLPPWYRNPNIQLGIAIHLPPLFVTVLLPTKCRTGVWDFWEISLKGADSTGGRLYKKKSFFLLLAFNTEVKTGVLATIWAQDVTLIWKSCRSVLVQENRILRAWRHSGASM